LKKAHGKPRIVLADDRDEILEAVSGLLRPDFDIVAAVRDGVSAIDAISQFEPDLVVLDISMPILNGLEAAARLQESGCRARVLFLTVHNERDYVEAAFSAGASGYVLKPRLGIDLLPAIREVLRGGTFETHSGRPEFRF
jgi:DNA-binding NarL/FixJ family response regulator